MQTQTQTQGQDKGTHTSDSFPLPPQASAGDIFGYNADIVCVAQNAHAQKNTSTHAHEHNTPSL